MNMLYVIENSQNNVGLGVYKKILDQCECFILNDIEAELISGDYSYKTRAMSKLTKAMPFFSPVKYNRILKLKKYDVYYVRYLFSHWNLIRFLKILKKSNKNIKILLEFPTYPYMKERAHPIFWVTNIRELISRHKLKRYTDRIVTFSDDEFIFNVPTIKAKNGIIVDKVNKRTVNADSKNINIIAVSLMFFRHGYDRFINGMGEYYKNGGKKNIILHFVGEGAELNKLKKLAADLRLEDKIIFYGSKVKSELDEIYDKANMALESLGWHRTGIDLSSSLKTREYVAKGLPVIGSCKVDIFNDDYPYYLKLPADETFININKVVDYYDKIFPDGDSFQKVHDEIREFALNTCDMSITMKPIIDYIKEK